VLEGGEVDGAERPKNEKKIVVGGEEY